MVTENRIIVLLFLCSNCLNTRVNYTNMIALAKTITISEEAYERLVESKKRGESFTEVILREFPHKGKEPDIMDFAGAWEGDEEESERIFAHVLEDRNKPARKVEI